MSLRWQPPARSPISLASLAAGAAALVAPGDARARLLETMRARLGMTDGLLTDSGTSALGLALRYAAPGRPVALPAWSCYDLATAAIGAGAAVVLYDLDPATLAPDAESLRSALRGGVGAVVVAHLFGIPQPLPDVAAEVTAAGGVLIEDAAQAAGGTLRGTPLGGFGPVTVLSFGRGKGLTGGGGGALLAGAAAMGALDAARRLLVPAGRGVGRLAGAAAQWVLARPAWYGVPASLPFLKLGETLFHPPHPPRGMPAAAAAATLRAVPLADAEVGVRRRHAARLAAAVRAPFGRVTPPEGAEPGWLRFPVLAPLAAAGAVRETAARQLGVAPGYPRPLATLPGFAGYCRNAGEKFPGAETLAARLITLPTHAWIEERDLDAVEQWMARW